MRFYFSAWMRPNEWLNDPKEVAARMLAIQADVERQVVHPLGQKFLAAVKPWGVALLFLREALEDMEKGNKACLKLIKKEGLRVSC
jgi:hypothetical protein